MYKLTTKQIKICADLGITVLLVKPAIRSHDVHRVIVAGLLENVSDGVYYLRDEPDCISVSFYEVNTNIGVNCNLCTTSTYFKN